jgi:hypothetical protein
LPGQSGGKWRQYLGPELSAYCRHQSAEIRGELLRCLRAKDAAASGIGAVQPEGRGYSLIIDTRGYGAIHNQKYSRPLTGNYEADLVGNRTRRIWDDVTGQRGAKNTLPLLVQTYARDTGEILSEINMPIMVGGRQWGCSRRL